MPSAVLKSVGYNRRHSNYYIIVDPILNLIKLLITIARIIFALTLPAYTLSVEELSSLQQIGRSKYRYKFQQVLPCIYQSIWPSSIYTIGIGQFINQSTNSEISMGYPFDQQLGYAGSSRMGKQSDFNQYTIFNPPKKFLYFLQVDTASCWLMCIHHYPDQQLQVGKMQQFERRSRYFMVYWKFDFSLSKAMQQSLCDPTRN
ncbi:hypothetical protein FGO68_gene10254 [Halteria grandinella]|uniref:Uncharacterized protein n=1 Tax=Halteria grandinella TaxID=5974 RepID=A0A8J8NSH9_HALGN|nr:hypothetical protein FGO68_gene10254 [Halteria grandinella]